MIRKLILFFCFPLACIAAPDPDPARFANEIAAFDAADVKSPPAKGGVVFTGSSSIRMLNIPKVFPGLEALNRGFGGSHISDVNHYLEQCVLRYEPSIVVFYCGSNDIWDKKPVEQVDEDFTEFRTRLFERVPKTKLIIMAIRPCESRKSALKGEIAMNQRFLKSAEVDERITYVAGSADRYLDKEGNAIPELFIADKLHMSDAGYEVWKELLTPLLPVPEVAAP